MGRLVSAISASGANLYALFASAILIFVAGRVLGSGEFGSFAAVYALVSIAGTTAHLSLSAVIPNRAAREPTHAWLSRVMAIMLVVAFVAGAAAACVATVVWHLAGGALGAASLPLLAFGLPLCVLIPLFQYGLAILPSLGQVGRSNAYQVIGRTLGLAGFVVLVPSNPGAPELMAAIVLGNLAIVGGQWATIFAAGAVPIFDAPYMRRLLVDGLKSHANAIGSVIITSAGTLVLSLNVSASLTGHFQMAMHVLLLILAVPTALSLLQYEPIARLGPVAAWRKEARIVAGQWLAFAAVASLAVLGLSGVGPLVLGPDYAETFELIPLLLIGALGWGLSALMTPQWLARGLFVTSALLSMTIAGLGFVALWLLVPQIGVVGAVVSYIVSGVLAALANLTFAFRISRQPGRWGESDGANREP